MNETRKDLVHYAFVKCSGCTANSFIAVQSEFVTCPLCMYEISKLWNDKELKR